MKITMLGTAGIGYPLTFCNCENCREARKRRGKSLRKRASILINDDLLIDLGPDTQTAFTMYDKDMSKVMYLLQTHIHTDHCDMGLFTTLVPYSGLNYQNTLSIYSHPDCLENIRQTVLKYERLDIFDTLVAHDMRLNCIALNHGDEVSFGNYKVKAIETLHDVINGSLLYLIQQNGKTIFYATDTNALTDTAFKELKGYKIDVVIMDHTFGDVDYSYSHLNKKLFLEQINKLKSFGLLSKNAQIFATHITHDGNPYHELAEKQAIENGYHIAYDGMQIEI